jgi:hypothetical protein
VGVSAIRHLPSAIRYLACAAACVTGTVGSARAQNIGPITFRDSLVMRQLVYRAPCPDPVPRAWSLVDSTLGRPPRCNLVEVAAQAIAEYYSVRPPRSGPGDPWNPLCVRIVIARNTGSTGLPGDWLVMFDLSVDNTVYVIIDRQSGSIGTITTMLGNVPAGSSPKCMS